jgi:hypothetical protein
MSRPVPLPPGHPDPAASPIQLVLCFETDDYTSPRGYCLSGREVYVFHSLYASVNCPAGVRIGQIYAVDSAGRVLGEAFVPKEHQKFVKRIRAVIEKHTVRWGPEGRPW